MKRSTPLILELRLDNLADPSSLRRLKSPQETFQAGKGPGTVWAERTADGRLKVLIETRDCMGYFDSDGYGFAFFEAPLSRSTEFHGESCPTFEPDGLPIFEKRKIDDGWWEVKIPLPD